ncbi:MAG: acyl-ACP--UDP-N-acetylglucosamine O-acyltransferase [Thermoanaerobaculia bacterium]|nr:acyl-ACP--UDP-N-acetylglucosamine O-acyltransferase [Thermoanaerobaculia bacterium]
MVDIDTRSRKETQIHPTAVVDPEAELGVGVVLGPHAVIGPRVEVGDRCVVDAGAYLRGPLRLGEENRIYSGACIGFDPQDLKFGGEETWLEVGSNNHFREHATAQRGTGKGGGVTRIGSHGLFMVGAHVAHDCLVGDHVIFANQGTLAGHVEVQDHATVGAFASVHQFCRVGAYAYIGGYSVITRDVLPFVKTVGIKPACYGLNKIGLQRKGFGEDELQGLERAYRLLVRSGLRRRDALEQIEDELGAQPRVRFLLDFVTSSQRGVVAETPRKKSGRGA